MLTKRMMLGAGALALALAVAACSEDRAGGATGVDEAPAVPPVRAPAPVAITRPPAAEGVASGGGGTGGGQVATVLSSSYYGGHQVVLSEVTTSSGAKVRRVTLDGGTLAEYAGADGGEADATVYADGQVLLQEMVSYTDASTVVIPQQYLGLSAPLSGGPQLQAALPCAQELAIFGGASLWLSAALMWAKVQPYSLAAWIDLRLALTAVGKSGWDLFACLQRAW